jgi:hypothetical protein
MAPPFMVEKNLGKTVRWLGRQFDRCACVSHSWRQVLPETELFRNYTDRRLY